MIVTLTRIDSTRVSYSVPSKLDVYRNFDRTYGKQFDPVERARVDGGIPLVWERVEEILRPLVSKK